MSIIRYRVRTKREQIAVFVIFAILSIATCVYVAVSYIRSVNSLVGKIAEVSLNETSNEVSNWVQSKSMTIDTLSKALVAFHGRPDQIQAYLENVRSVDADFIDIFFGTAEPPRGNGYVVYATKWAAPADYDWTTRPWFTQAVGSDDIAISAAYKDLQTGKTIFSISKRVYAEGRLIGVLSSDISTATVKDIIDGVYIAKGSTVRIIDGDGNYINITKETAQNVTENNAFDSPELQPLKTRILSGSFLIWVDSVRNQYFASIGLPHLGWIMTANGSFSSFENTTGTIIRFTIVLLFLAGLFMAMLLRTWRTSSRLLLATETIEQTNRDLERTVAERTASLRNILDNAEEGFLTFSSPLVIDPSYSRGCVDIFGKEINGLSVPDVLFPGMTQIISDFRQGFDLYFKGKSKADIIFDLSEKQTEIRGRIIRISYKETAGQRILCILTDITLATEMDEKNRREAETHQRILRALHNKHFFAQFLDSADNLFANLELFASTAPSEEETTLLMRAIHTFKGDAGFFAFNGTQGLAHESETLIADSRQLGTAISYKEMMIQIRKAYYKELKTITDTMGEKWIDESGGVFLPRAEYQKLFLYLRKKTPDDMKLLSYLDSFRKITITELFSRLPFAAAVTAERLGKKIKPMTIVGGTLKIVPDRYQALVESCVHIVNNMVDHGIEYPYERESIQKPPEGRIELAITVEKSTMILEFRDDGRGINPREIERIAKERGLIPEGRSLQTSELFNLIFTDGFTTKTEASTVSGRGIGLAAVRAEVAKLGGTIEARSKFGKGTSFEITIPLTI